VTSGYGSISLAVPELMACRRSAADTFSVPVAERSVTFTLHPTADGNDIAAIAGSELAKE
jgi:hypothetical protein